jgi:hypothetical protein
LIVAYEIIAQENLNGKIDVQRINLNTGGSENFDWTKIMEKRLRHKCFNVVLPNLLFDASPRYGLIVGFSLFP